MARILFDNLSSALSTIIALPCTFITSTRPDLAASNYECRYRCLRSARPFIPFARGATEKLARRGMKYASVLSIDNYTT